MKTPQRVRPSSSSRAQAWHSGNKSAALITRRSMEADNDDSNDGHLGNSISRPMTAVTASSTAVPHNDDGATVATSAAADDGHMEHHNGHVDIMEILHASQEPTSSPLAARHVV